MKHIDITSLSTLESHKLLTSNNLQELTQIYNSKELKLLVNKNNQYIKENNIKIEQNKNIPIPNTQPKTNKNYKPQITSLPPIKTQAKTFVKSITDWAKGGFGTVSPQTFQNRINICKKCEHWQHWGSTEGRCRKCGCISAKHRMNTSRCPLNPPKWGPVSKGQ